MITAVLLLFATSCLSWVILRDLRYRKIGHGAIVVIALLSVFIVCWYELPINTALFQAGLVFLAGFVLFFFGVCGAGDVKLLTVISLAVSDQWWPWMLFLTGILGGIVALGLLLAGWLGKPEWRAMGVPYALAIAPSGGLAIWLTLIDAT
ncbi:prepilin peptidase [Salinivibrio sp. ES.052]|uniref:A24 family peptidase n=1 Tax=Salinivibrio sp. ES.052 TaxID=1882823 RepID=UPI00092973FF|nr:prepilin peptidase [Salinivibrio sp. ES.052]SIN72654.1 prepilin peptidase CpaA [Salinivibrio sp. ES.052]